MKHLPMTTSLLILWLCAVHTAQGQGSVIAGDTVAIKTADRLKGAVLCFAPSSFCGGCSQDLDLIAYECQKLGVPMRVYVQDGGLGNGIYGLAEDRPMVTMHDDELGAYARLYRVARSPFMMSVSGQGLVLSTGIPGARGFEVDSMLEVIRSAAAMPASDVYFGPKANQARFVRTVCPLPGDTLMEAALKSASIMFLSEQQQILLAAHSAPSRVFLLDSSGAALSTTPKMPSNFTYRINWPDYFALSTTGDSVLAFDWDIYDDRAYLYWLRLKDGRADTIPVPPILKKRYTDRPIYHQSSRTAFFPLRHDESRTGAKLADRSTILALNSTGYRMLGLRPQIYDTDSVLPVESGTYMTIHGNHLWTISQFRDSLTRYDLRTWDSLTVPIGLSSTYYADPLPLLREHYRDPITRRDTRSRTSYCVDILSDPGQPYVAVVYVVPISKLTGKEASGGMFDVVWVALIVDATTGKKIREVEFPMATIPDAYHNGLFLCSVFYGSRQMVKWYDMPAE